MPDGVGAMRVRIIEKRCFGDDMQDGGGQAMYAVTAWTDRTLP
jgi:hypothetical protein